MCGIWALVGTKPTLLHVRSQVQKLNARGPEGSRFVDLSGAILGFTRLAINGLSDDGMQPMKHSYVNWICNGEIYNWKELKSQHLLLDVNSGSDCEVLGPLYEQYADNLTAFFRALDGVFAMVLVDLARNRMIVGRDPYGVRPLYEGLCYDANKKITTRMYASEIKALVHVCDYIQPVMPGCYKVIKMGTCDVVDLRTYHTPPWITNPLFTPAHPSGLAMATAALRFALEEAVHKRVLNSERPIAALLSGGIDSSLIAALVAKELRTMGKPPLKTFSIGMAGSTDLKYARKVSEWIQSDHTEVVLTADDFFRAIPSVISSIESYDTTTVRASVGNWLVSKAIKEQSECKVVFNGDGSDEVFGSYLYFYRAPTDRHFEEETERLLKDIHQFDVLRSDRSISSHGLEPRTPFLDKQFVAVAKSIASCWRRPSANRCEKWILRHAFDDGVTLPKEVLWRRKEAFSDGVSGTEKSWYEEIQDRVGGIVPVDWKSKRIDTMHHLPPQTAEQYYYRYLFHAAYGWQHDELVPYFWMPKWSPETTDPSARTLGVYSSS